MTQDWKKIMPISAMEEDCIISRSGDLTVALHLTKPEIHTIPHTVYADLCQQYLRAIKILAPGTILHLQDWYWQDEYIPPSDQPASWLQQASNRFFYERPWIRHEAYVFLTRPAAQKPARPISLANITRVSLSPEGLLDQSKIRNFLAASEQFCQILEQGGLLKTTRLTADTLWSTRHKAGLIERYCTLSDADTPVLQDIKCKDQLQIGDKHVRIYTLTDEDALPTACADCREYTSFSTPASEIHVGFASPLGVALPFNHIYNQFLIIKHPSETLKQLETKRLRMQALAKLSPANAVGARITEEFIQHAAESQEPIVASHVNIMTWDSDQDRLARHGKEIAAALSSMEITPKLETISAAPLWFAAIPGNEAALPAHETMLGMAGSALCFTQQETNHATSISTSGLRLGDRLTGRPLNVDLCHEPKARQIINNWNTLVIAGSGGGKSFFINHLVASEYEAASHVLILDIGHSYEIQCALHNGQYFACSENNRLSFNPFSVHPDNKLDQSHREHMKTLLIALWKKPEEPVLRSEYVAISNAINLYFEKLYDDPHLTPGFNSFYEFMQNDFRAVLKKERVRERDFDLSNFLYVMRMFYKDGEYDYLLNARDNPDLIHQRFVVFDLEAIRGNAILFTATTISIMALFDEKIRLVKGIKKMIVIEEAWEAIARDNMAEYIKYLYKTMRKHLGHPVLVSQEIEDLVSSDIIRQTVIANSDIRILLDQSKYQQKFDTIIELLGLSDHQKAEILSINRGQEPGRHYKDVWIGLGATHSRVYRLEVSREEYYCYTSDQSEKIKVWESIRKHGDVRKGIQALIAAENNKPL